MLNSVLSHPCSVSHYHPLLSLLHYGTVLRWQGEKYEAGVRRPPACEVVGAGTGERPLLGDVTKQRSESRN
jgi:hypothetical protein